MKKIESLLKKHGAEVLVFGIVITGVFFLYQFTAGTYIEGYVAAELNESTFVDVPVEEEIDEILETENEVDIILEYSNKNSAEQAISALSKKEFNEKNKFKNFNGVAGRSDKKGIHKLRRNPHIKRIILDKKLDILLDDTIGIINADDAWMIRKDNLNITGGKTVCIIDTGIDYNHQDLANNYIGGYDFVNLDNDPIDDHGHGTHVAGIVAGNGSIKGVAPGSNIVSIKVCNSNGGCSASDVTSAIEWCSSNSSSFNIGVITMSLGGGLYSSECSLEFPTINAAVQEAVSNNIVVIAASGNAGNTVSIAAPACLDDVIAVGGTDKSDNMYVNGNRNSLIGVLAPAVNIKSSKLNGGTIVYTGTSMAAPHAAGLASLLQQYSPGISPGEVLNAMRNGKSINDAGSGLDYIRIDAYPALLSLDDENPEITIDGIENNSISGSNWVFINISSNEELSSAIISWNNNNLSMVGSYIMFYMNVTNISALNYYNVYGVDLAGNIGNTGIRLLSLESNPPVLNLTNPGNNSILDYKQITFEFTMIDDMDDFVICSIGVDSLNKEVYAFNNTGYLYNKSISDGIHNWNVSCKDSTLNVVNSGKINFSVDGPPIIANLSPIGSFIGESLIINFTTDETSYCKGSLNGNYSISNMSIGFNGTLLHYYSIDELGNFNIYIGCNDTSNNIAYDNWEFSLETTTTTTPPSSGGGSSGGGGSSSGGGSTNIPSQVITTEINTEQPTQPREEQPAPATTASTTIIPETIVERPSGFTGLMGNVVKGITGNKGITGAIVVISLLSLGYFIFRKYIGKGVKKSSR